MMEKYQEFVQWMVDNSVGLSQSLRVGPSELGGYGVFAQKKIPKETILLSVEKKHVLSPVSCGIANLLEDNELEGMIGLTVAYMFERAQGKESPWYAYLETIEEAPSKVSLPRFWTEEQQSWLIGTEVEAMGGLDESEVSDVYADTIQPFIAKHVEYFKSKPEYFTYEGYRNSLMAVCSRAFEVDYFRGLSLVPGACLFNHSDHEDVHFEASSEVCIDCGDVYCEHVAGDEIETAMADADLSDDDFEDVGSDEEVGPDVPILVNEDGSMENTNDEEEDEDEESDTCDIRTIRNVSSGAEIFNSYGDLPNGVLLSRYGFAVWDNVHETISLSQEIKQLVGDDLKKRIKWWKQNCYQCVFGINPEDYDAEEHSDVPHPEAFSWHETTDVLSHGQPSTGLRLLLNILGMNGKKFGTMQTRAARGDFSALPKGRDGSKMWKQALTLRAKRFQDGNMPVEEYAKLLNELCNDNTDSSVRKRFAIIVRGTEKLVLERASKYRY